MALTRERPQRQADPPGGLLRRDEVAMALFGAWALVGLYLDGWAHTHGKPESFFTPWHLVLYSGVGVAVAWFTFDGWRRGRHGVPGPDDRLGGVGLAVFGAGAFGDFAWHEVFGIEQDLEALLSPTHLALMIGGVLMLTAPVRSAWMRADTSRPTARSLWPAIVSMTLSAGVVSFFFLYLSAFRFDRLAYEPGWTGQVQQIHALSSVLVTNAILLGATMALVTRWRTPFGTFTFMYTALALAMTGIDEFRSVGLAAAGLVGGVAADVLVGRLGPRSRLFAAAVPFVTWTTWFGCVQATGGVGWPAELVAGTVVLATLTGWALSVLVFPMPRPSPAEPADAPSPSDTSVAR